jgi:hypothetical protein
MVDTSLTFNEHDIHLITKELQGSPNNTPMKNINIHRRDLQKELLEYKVEFYKLTIKDILELNNDKALKKSDILINIVILGNFKPKKDLKIKTTSKYFWLLVLKCKIFRVNIFQNKFSSMTLCKFWRKLYKANFQRIFQLIEDCKQEINMNKTLK